MLAAGEHQLQILAQEIKIVSIAQPNIVQSRVTLFNSSLELSLAEHLPQTMRSELICDFGTEFGQTTGKLSSLPF